MAGVFHLLKFLFLHQLFVSGVFSASFTFINNCTYTVWPAVHSTSASARISTTGFVLQSRDSRTIAAPDSWSGRFWGRTHCNHDSSGNFSCATGDCGSGKIECAGKDRAPPATLVEFTLSGAGGLGFYDIYLVDGFNLPLSVVPQGGIGDCLTAQCLEDLNLACPEELRLLGTNGTVVGCSGPCETFQIPQFCCRVDSSTCRPSLYSLFFKNACPQAYSFPYDDKSTFTCASADYVITFCPGVGSQRLSRPTSIIIRIAS